MPTQQDESFSMLPIQNILLLTRKSTRIFCLF